MPVNIAITKRVAYLLGRCPVGVRANCSVVRPALDLKAGARRGRQASSESRASQLSYHAVAVAARRAAATSAPGTSCYHLQVRKILNCWTVLRQFLADIELTFFRNKILLNTVIVI